MGGPKFFLTFLLLLCLVNWAQSTSSYVQEACSVTRYQSLCVHSLASFSNSAKRSPSRWARAGVSVTISETKSVASYLASLRKSGRFVGRSGAALSDCVECFGDAIDELHRSLGVLRGLNATEFETQMGDLKTWLSAALTDQDTCLDGFEELGGRQVGSLRSRVLNASYMTSNALALVNKLASSGLENAGIDDP